MEVLAVLAVVGGLATTAIVLALQKGAANRGRDRAEWKSAGLLKELTIAARKLKAQTATIISLERLVIEGGGDSRNLLHVLGEHRRLLSEADADAPHPDLLRPDETPPEDPDDPGVSTGSGLLGAEDGATGGGVRDPRSHLDRRGEGVSGGDG